MVDGMSDLARQQKLAAAKKKLKKFQKAKSPVNGQAPYNGNLGPEILRGIQTNHIFKTPPLTLANKQVTPEKNQRPNQISINQKLNFDPTTALPQSLTPSPASIPDSTPTASSFVDEQQKINNYNGVITNKKDVEDLEQMLSSYKRTNEQLGNQVQEQRKQIILLQEHIKKEGHATTQLTEQRAIKEQLEVHIQTIGILVSEKSELQSSISIMQKKLSTKEAELTETNKQLQKIRQQVTDLEKNTAAQLTANERLIQTNENLIVERDRCSNKLYEVSHEKEDIRQQNSELHAKLQVKVEDCSILLNQVNDLHVKLQKGELMVQQLSSSSVDPQAVRSWQAEKEELVKLIDEQKSIVKKLVADKAELLEKHNDTESHYEIQIEELENKINSLDAERHTLSDKTNLLSTSLSEVQNQLETIKLEKSQVEQSLSSTHPESNHSVTSVEHQTLLQEKKNLEKELDLQINENRRLGRVVFDQNCKIEELESKISRLNAETTDRSSLLNQIQADKETISRALQQNKALKEQLEELEQGFVKMSNSTADLTSKLESEQHGNKDVANKLSEVQIELEETKMELVNKSAICDNLSEELLTFKKELHNAQLQLSSKEMDIDLLNTELLTVKNDMSITTKNKTIPATVNPSDSSQHLQKELYSAQETINHLLVQNTQLRESFNELQYSHIHGNQGDGSLYPVHEIPTEYTSQSSTILDYQDEGDDLTSEERHARSWEELENDEEASEANEENSDGSYSLDDNEAIRITKTQVDEMQLQLQQLQEEREKIIYLLQEEREKSFETRERIDEHVVLQVNQQLKQRERELQEHFYEQTEVLHNKVQSLQEALEIMRKNEDIADFDMTSDGITMPLLKTSFMQLQKRYKSAMDAKAQLLDRIEQLEHVNQKLETETETIGEYIALYQTQRQALKAKFNDKDRVISQLSNEHGRMQAKVAQLHQLVMQMLSERSGIENKNKQLQELVNRRLALQTGDSTNNGEIPQLQYNLDSLFGQMTLTPDEENELIKDTITVDESLRGDSTLLNSNDETTQQILQLFEQLETTGEGFQSGWLSPAARKHDFTPCKNCMGDPIYI